MKDIWKDFTFKSLGFWFQVFIIMVVINLINYVLDFKSSSEFIFLFAYFTTKIDNVLAMIRERME